MEEKNKQITSLSLKNGLILGIISIVLSATLYFVDPLFVITHFWVALIVGILNIVLLVVFGLNIRKEIGGFWNFSQAFKSFLIISLILIISTTIYSIVIVKIVNPDYPAQAASALIDAQKKMMSSFNLSPDQIDEAIAKAGNMEEKFQPSVKNLTTNFAISLAIYAVISLILAAILKKHEPLVFDSLPDGGGAPVN